MPIGARKQEAIISNLRNVRVAKKENFSAK
jgi:hypothetical protein